MYFNNIIKIITKYKWLLQELIIRDLKLKYRRSILGYLWSVLNPLMMMVIMTIVFSNMFRFDIPQYPVYLLCGQLVFNFFAESTNMAMSSILGGAGLIKKVYIPKYIFPVSRILSCFATMLFALVALFIVMCVMDVPFRATLVLMPVALLYILVFCIGVGLMLSTFVVFFRDVQHLYGVLITGLNYLTPIFYPVSMLPEWLQDLIILNPLYSLVTLFRKVTIYGEWPTINEHLICIGFASLFLFLGAYIFNKKQNDFILYI